MLVGQGHPIVVAGLVASLVAVGVGMLALRSTIDPGRSRPAFRVFTVGLATPLAVVAIADVHDLAASPRGLPGRCRRIGGRQILMLVTIAGVPVVPGIWAGGATGNEVTQLVVITAGVGVILSHLLALASHVGRRTLAASTFHVGAMTSITVGLVALRLTSS